MAAKPKTVDEYFTGLTAESRAPMEKLRQSIRTVLPDAEEYIRYSMPAFRGSLDGIVWYAGWKSHLALYGLPFHEFKDDLASYELSDKGTLRIPFEKPFPASLVRKLLRAHLKGLEADAVRKMKTC